MGKEDKLYSDGEIEDVIISALENGQDVLKVPYDGGAIFHNFTDSRENLINWYSFKSDASVLEIGAGMGALTGILCDRCNKVTAFEHSPKRSEIIKQRHKNRNNLDVVCGDIFDYEFNEKFDYILLIGVLEYVGINSESENPYTEILKRINNLLKKDGTLLLAIENRFGLKYWCGAAEDHTGIPFDGISGYLNQGYTTRYHKGGVRTFDRSSLESLLNISGFDNLRWYYPLPDYKFPMAIFTDGYLPQKSDIDSIKFSYSAESELIANEKVLYEQVINNNTFPFFANSFFVEAKTEELSADFAIYASLKRDYKSDFRIATIINSRSEVIKRCISKESRSHLIKYINNYNTLKKSNVPIVSIVEKDNEIIQRFQDLPRADIIFSNLLSNGSWEEARQLLTCLKENIKKTSSSYRSSKCNMSSIMELEFEGEEEILIDGYIDMTFANSFSDGKELLFFDQEWRYVDVPLKYILYRSVKYSMKKSSPAVLDKLYAFIGINSGMIEQFNELENRLLAGMMDEKKCNVFDPDMYHEGLTLHYKMQMFTKDKMQKFTKDKMQMEKRCNQIQTEFDMLERKYNKSVDNYNEIKKTCDEKERYIQELKQTVLNKEGHINLLLEVEREYEREKTSKTYRFAVKLRKISLKLFPVNSKRRFITGLFVKIMRHPIKMIKMINPRRIRNCFIILKSEGASSALNHFRLVEEYEKSRTVPLELENITIVPASEREKPLEEYQKLVFPEWENPKVSIVIPVYNQFDYTYHCLESILKNSGECKYEIIVANDCSTDLTRRLEEVAEGITVINNDTNLRFLMNCNNAADFAKGEYILFLNNDTQVQANWLLPLVDVLDKNEKIGMVGSKLIYSDGYLQEAGGIMWKDASAWNYGNRQNPNDSEFNYVHEVDYMSGAAIMIRSSLWKEIGGFDKRFVPAYCEDSDLAFEVRRHGSRVVYQPKSVVVHFEGISNGTDVAAGQKKYQVENQNKFYEKWKSELEAAHFENGTDVFLARERSGGKKHILVIDHYVPQYDKDAGSKTTFMYLKMLVKKGYQITFLGDNFYQHEPYTSELQQMGILVLYGPKYAENWKEWLKENIQYFDIFYLNRPHITIKYIDFIKEHARGKIIYYGHDLHFLRLKREYELSGDRKQLEESERWLEQELYIMRQADMSYYPSVVESDEINKIDPSIPVKAITAYVYEEFHNIDYEADQRKGLLFVGGFGHDPNLDAVLWFLDKIYPEVYKQVQAPFYIVGSKAPDSITKLTMEGVVVKGFVSEEELQSLYDTCRIAVVPLRYGAGVKGKVVEALYYGIPVITTSVGAEGIQGIENMAVIEDNEKDLITAICDTYNNNMQLKKMSCSSQQFIKDKFSTEAVWDIVKDDFS